ncbi:MAG TPA: ABC transporter ATP-binding protein [Balneolaceae bacterium]|nr:ABC transporter ATP-binding protein [Balneolaceae bacterium]
MEQASPAILIKNLKKSYDENEVLKGINLEVYPGQVIGYIGPNGAGKSTTVKILTGLLPEFEGEVEILGQNLREDTLQIKRHIGYVPEAAEMYEVLTPMEFLDFIGKLYEMKEKQIAKRAERLLAFFDLADNKDDRMDTFSKGMRQKVLLISGLLHDPKIIFLDEPLSGLDANAVIKVKNIIDRLAQEGKTIFYCSHMMDVVEKVSNRILLINHGTIVADGSFDELRQSDDESLERIFSNLTGNQKMEDNTDEFLESFED